MPVLIETCLPNQNIWKHIQLIIAALSGIDITSEFTKIINETEV